MNGPDSTILGGLGRVSLCALPTPLVEAGRLAEALGGPRIFIKRDDLTGLALGGNKARALEFVMAAAAAAACDVVIAVGPQHSNQLCCIAAAARKCGMDAVLLLLRGDNRRQGNMLLFDMLGAQVRFTDVDLSNPGEAYAQMADLAEELRSEGRKPLELKYGPLPVAGLAGYALLFQEILGQTRGLRQEGRLGSPRLHIFVGSGSGSTQAGLILGRRLMGAECDIHGVMLDPRFDQQRHEGSVLATLREAAALFQSGVEFDAADVHCIDGYDGEEATTRSKAADAAALVAHTEGILLDPVYTSRVMAATIDHIRDGRIPPEDSVVFYHSGGVPAIFSHSDSLKR